MKKTLLSFALCCLSLPALATTVTTVSGEALPLITCAPNTVCDIQLPVGERITKNGVNRGDSRWEITPALSGEGKTEQMHLLIKPTAAAPTTVLFVNTNRRALAFRLTANVNGSTPIVKVE